MKQFLLLMCAAILCFAGYESTLFAEDAKEMTDSEVDAYYSSLKQQVDKQNKLVEDMLQSVKERKTIFSQAQRAEMENAIVDLDVKRTLYSNFYNKESVKKSPVIREKLLQVMSQRNITEADLASLQSVVQQEKNRYNIR